MTFSGTRYDVAIVGGGIAGASLAAELAPHASVVLLEAEEMAGVHATGRSAAFWSETYGGAAIQPLTALSGESLRVSGFLKPLGSLHVGRAEDRPRVDRFLAEFAGTSVELREVDPAPLVPGLRPEWTLGVSEPSCAYIDVAGLHADRLSTARRAGAAVMTSTGLASATRDEGGWRVETAAGPVSARLLVNAAGAWADEIARRASVRPIGISAYRRTLVQLRTDPPAPADLPHVIDIAGGFYFKPETGSRLWLSPHDEVPTDPCDAQPEEMDVAIAIDRFERVVDWRVTALERKWAGLRSFAPDRLPVFGFDAAEPAFFWCAGQGGFGIQTAPAAAALCAALILDRPPPAGLDPQRYVPTRFS